MSDESAPAAVVGNVPHYGGAAVVEGSVIFLLILGVVLGLAFYKRRR